MRFASAGSPLVSKGCNSSTDRRRLAYRKHSGGVLDHHDCAAAWFADWPLILPAFIDAHHVPGWNPDPTRASRPFSKIATVFVIAKVRGLLLIETWSVPSHAARHLRSEMIAGYGSNGGPYQPCAPRRGREEPASAIGMAIAEEGIHRRMSSPS